VIIAAAIMLLSLSVYIVYMLSIHATLTLACLTPMPLISLLSVELSRRAFRHQQPAFSRLPASSFLPSIASPISA
jgi:hypothetical protein